MGLYADRINPKTKDKPRGCLGKDARNAVAEMERTDQALSVEQPGTTSLRQSTTHQQPSFTNEQLLHAFSEAVVVLKSAGEQIEHLDRELFKCKEDYRRSLQELAAAEMREVAIQADLARTLADRDQALALTSWLQAQLAPYRRPLWRRMFGLAGKWAQK